MASAGARELDAQIRRLRKLAGFGERSAPAVAVAIKDETTKQVAAAKGPTGQKWQPTKTGGQPLKGAAAHVTVGVIGSTVIMRITGHHARHHLGAVKGKVRRELIPNDRIPEQISRAISRVITGEFDAIMLEPT